MDEIKVLQPPELYKLRNHISNALEKTFSLDSTQFNRYKHAAYLEPSFVAYSIQTPSLQKYKTEVSDRIKSSISILGEAIRALNEDLEELGETILLDASITEYAENEVFVVHGHDVEARETVARYLTQINFQPIILHEQASSGMTIIEKIEKHSKVGFAVILLTPDDLGGKDKDNLLPRARQNVVLELGYFIAKLGRNRVCALKKGNVETPSDFDGVVYIPLDDNGAWKFLLAQEMKAAGLSVDLNKVVT